MTTNVDVLLNLKYQIFVDEVLTKTRVNGLQWTSITPNVYYVSICQTPVCQTPVSPMITWTIQITRNLTNVGPDNDYTYYLEVQQNGHPFLTISSLNIDQVETLYKQIDIMFNGVD